MDVQISRTAMTPLSAIAWLSIAAAALSLLIAAVFSLAILGISA